MSSEFEDTETLVALVSSLLEGNNHDQAAIIDALVLSDGDAERAAKLLNSSERAGPSTTSPKKTEGRLDKWLQRRSPSRGPSNTTVNTTQSLKRPRSLSPTKVSRQSSPNNLLHSPSFKKPRSTSATFPGSSSLVRGRAVTNEQFMAMLRPSNSSDVNNPGPAKFPPLTLTTPEQIAKHTPCTLHASVLPPELASRLFYTMLDESESWQRNKWWLFERIVESPHRTSFYVRRSNRHINGTAAEDMQEAAQFWYNGRPTAPPDPFPAVMDEACDYIEKVVNTEMRKRTRYPLEWGGEPALEDSPGIHHEDGERERIIWRANVAASNRYEGSQESVGFHSDQLTYLGPYATIASLSLGTTRVFRLREVIPADEKDKRSARTFNIPLAHNTLVIMHASCQETFKHSIPPQRTIDPFHPPFPHPCRDNTKSRSGDAEASSDSHTTPPSNARINITFRFYRPDFRPSSTPRCKCGVPCILRPNMKNRYSTSDTVSGDDKRSEDATRRDLVAKYWWTCYAGAQNDGKGCGFWKVMDVKAEGRGPFAGNVL